MEQEPEGLIRRIGSVIEDINDLAAGLNKDEEVFRAVAMEPLRYSCAEAGFLRAVSWLYVLYYEAGKVNVRFLLERLHGYGLDADTTCHSHYSGVHGLRTTLQHSLNPDESDDLAMSIATGRWLRERCGREDPEQEEEWQAALIAVLAEAIAFLETLLACMHLIGEDQFCLQIVDDWNFRCSRYHSPHEFDRIVSIVASDLGQDYIDPVRVRKRYYDQWSKEMELLHGNYDFETEARKRVELVLLKSPILPITGEDIMREFGISPGPRIGGMLQRARILYEATPCNADELLERLRNET